MIQLNKSIYVVLVLLFLLGNHNGYIALWETGSADPMQVFPVAVSSLPPDDQEALDHRIPIENTQALNQLLEDYLS